MPGERGMMGPRGPPGPPGERGASGSEQSLLENCLSYLSMLRKILLSISLFRGINLIIQ